VVTGGSRGIGAATAKLAAERGYPVVIFYRSRQADADVVLRSIERAGGRALAVQVDVASEASIQRGFGAVDQIGWLEVLVNNAALTGPVSRLADLPAQVIEEVCRVNVVGAFLAAREAIRRMSKRSGGLGGSIVNVSSGASRAGSPGVWIHYAATKGAIDTMTIGLAKEVAADGIRVNAVRPGLVQTEIHAVRPAGQLEQMARAVPLGRIARPEEIARTILWLASDEASYVTGALLDAGGGL
jgi:NAD(P)-dependent dehydrogenase (short-subunit alcohol dehydrogenase family)